MQRGCENGAVPYPLFVRLAGRRVVVVGAGGVAARKVETMLAYGADVTVVAPEAVEPIAALARAESIAWERRRYVEGDLAGAALAIVATGDSAVDEAAYREAVAENTLVNVVDVPELCTCIVPSVMRRGQLQVAVSTNGAAPSVAREVRRELEERFPAWWEDYIDLLADVRALVKERVPGPAQARTPLFEAVRAAGLEERFAAGERPDARNVYDAVVVPLVAPLAAGGEGGVA